MNSLRLLLAVCTLVPFSHAQTTPSPAAVATAAAAQQSGLAKINVPGTKDFNPDQPVVTMPKVVKSAKPKIPKQAQQGNLSGKVDMTMTVDETGKPQDVHVDTPAGHGFDEAALKAVRHYRFEPATRDGKPVAVTMKVHMRFESDEDH